MRNTQASKWQHKVDRDRATTKVVRAIRLGTRVKVRINPGRGNKWRCKRKVVARRATAMAMWCKHKVVARRATAMMMVTRLWREPGTRHMILEWQIGWGLAHWTQMTSA